MSNFKAVLVEHGYETSAYEKDIITAAGGEFLDADTLPLEEALRECQDAEAVMVRRIEVTPELIATFSKCKIITRYGVGTDNVDVQAATEAGIFVVNVPGYCIDEVSDQAAALLLSCIRQVPASHQKMREGGWDVKRPVPIRRVRGRTLGVLGFGNIGQMFVQKMKGWGLEVLVSDPHVDPSSVSSAGAELVEFSELCRRADYISLHAPLTEETRHIINADTLALMKSETILVNTSRGGLVDTQALLDALDRKQILVAGLDVFEEEPPPAEHPLRSHPRLVLSDHMGWHSLESQVELQSTVAEEVVRVCTGGVPQSLANPELIDQTGRFAEWQPVESMIWQLKRLGLYEKFLDSQQVKKLGNSA